MTARTKSKKPALAAPSSSRIIPVRIWTTTDKEAYNAGHELVVPGGRVSDDDREIAADFFQCEKDRVSSIRSSMTLAAYNKLAEAAADA